MATVSLVQDFVMVNEGDAGTTEVMMCLRLVSFEDGLDRDVELLLNTNTLTTSSKYSYVGITECHVMNLLTENFFFRP